MTLQIITQPLVEPVTLAEAKTLLRVETSDEDALLTTLITTARMTVEANTGRSLVTRTLEETRDRWPASRSLVLPAPPLQAVQSVMLLDSEGGEKLWSANNYTVETVGPAPRIVLKPGVTWPAVTRPAGGIRIRFMAGYGDAATDVPPPLGHAVLLLVAHWYENRLPVVINAAAAQVPGTVNALVANYRLARL